MTTFLYCLLIHKYLQITNRWLVLLVLQYQNDEIRRHIEIRSCGRVSPHQVDCILGEVAYCLIKASNNGRLISFPLAYAKKIADNLINKTIKQEIKRRKEKLISYCSDLEQNLPVLSRRNELYSSPEYQDF